MAACEKCWQDAYRLMLAGEFETQTDAYMYLLNERKDSPCDEQEQKNGNSF